MLFNINAKGNKRKADISIGLEKEEDEPGFFEGITNLIGGLGSELDLLEAEDDDDIIDELEDDD